MIDINSLLQSNYGIWLYLIIFVLSFGESLAFVGLIVPGSVALIISGLLASQGSLNVWLLLLWASSGAILGDSTSYYLGKTGVIKFHQDNWLFKQSLLEKGKIFFSNHGAKSVFIGRFIGWVRPVVPFVAGLFDLKLTTFLIWNIASGIIWAAAHIALGYYFGGAIGSIEGWTFWLSVWGAAGLLVAYGLHRLRASKN